MEQELKADQSLIQNFTFSCLEIDLAPSDSLPQVHHMLLEKMIHTHGNEIVQNRRMLANIAEGKVVDAPMMLRDGLKVLATQFESGSSQE